VSPAIVVVTFYSRGGSTETLATAAAVGAVQARAGIRMRRLPDLDPAVTLRRFPQHGETLRRMHKEYVAPREADVLAAAVLIVASPPDLTPSSEEWTAYLEQLTRLGAEGKLRGKVGAVVDNGPACGAFSSIMQQLGIALVPPIAGAAGDDVARAVALGRAAVAAAQAR
jgi:multimeric flavodoxin WrbA